MLKLNAFGCALLTVLLVLPIAFSGAQVAEGADVFFSEDFDGTALDRTKWTVQENTNLSGYPAWGGAIALNDSCVWLSSEGSVFPWINTISDPFPSSGDFEVSWRLTYTCVADWGDGLVIYCPPHNDSSNPYRDRILTLWAGDQGPTIGAIYIELFGHNVWSISVPGFRPTSEAHVYRLEYRQGTYSVYVDGKIVASQESQVRPDGIGIGHPPVYTLPNSPESTQRWAYWGWTSSKTDYVRVETLGENGSGPKLAELTMSTSTETQEIGYRIDITGAFTSEGKPVPNAQILLSYVLSSLPGDWNPITVATTDPEGSYIYSWLPTATGLFTVRASYVGTDYEEVEVTRNVSVLQTSQKAFFFIESNSTLTSITFNSSSQEISFTVSGPSGTTGYVKFVVDKKLVPDAYALKVFLDGIQLQHAVDSDGDNWLLTFQYSHSSHNVVISIPEVSSADDSFLAASATLVFLALAAPLGLVLLFRKRRKLTT